MRDGPLIILTAAEASGDQHAANLARAIRGRLPAARLVAFGGPRLAEAGVELLADLTARSAMLLGSVLRAPRMLAHYLRFDRFVERNPVALHIPVDSPAVNLALAGRSRRYGVPVLYYIAPQLWAWGDWRMDKLRRRVNHIACILPFEPAYFAPHAIPASFVGHPLFEPLSAFAPDESFINDQLPAGSPKIALLPGSRGHEIADHLPAQVRAAAAIGRRYPDAAFAVAAPPSGHGHILDLGRMIRDTGIATLDDPATGRFRLGTAPLALATGRLHDVLAWADLALTVSGSVTLEVAWFGVPMVVLYKVKPWQWRLIGRRLIKTEFLCLPNILGARPGRPLVPELMPWFGQDEPIIEAMASLLDDPARRAQLRKDLKDLVRPLAAGRASERTADLAIDLIQPAH